MTRRLRLRRGALKRAPIRSFSDRQERPEWIEQAGGSMAESASSQGSVSTARLILLPALISVAVTTLRLVGELQHWSSRWFSTDTGGIVPDGVSWVIGISWMAPLFGIYFALR